MNWLTRVSGIESYILAIPTLILCFLTFYTLSSVGGDAAIYFTFAKNFWSLPFSVRPDGNAVFGATGPLWVLWLSIFGDNFAFLKFANVLLVVLVTAWSARRIPFLILVPLVFLLPKTFVFMMLLGYEAPLFYLLFLILYCHIFQDIDDRKPEHFWVVGLSLGLLILVRPEAIFLTTLLLADLERRRFFINFALTVLPLLFYLMYMTIQTGDFVASSIYERVLRHGVGEDVGSAGVASRLRVFLEGIRNPFYLLGIWTMIFHARGDNKWYLLLVPAVIFFAVLCLMDSPRWRYFLLLDMLCVLSISKILYDCFDFSALKVSATFVFSIYVISNFCLNSAYFLLTDHLGENKASTFEKRFAPDLERAFDSLDIAADESVLIYEFGSQYSSTREFVSIDGIVGAFPKKFFSVAEFEKAALDAAAFYVSSMGCNRPKFEGSFVSSVCESEATAGVTATSIVTPTVTLKRVYQNPDFISGADLTSWNAVYSIHPTER